MPPQKRRRSSVYNNRSRKKRKHGSFDIELSDDEGPYYKVKDIIDENRIQYLIDWENNSQTGEKYAPTWEPKEHANQQAVNAWKQKKITESARRRTHRTRSVSSNLGLIYPVNTSLISATHRPRRTNRRVIVSSSSFSDQFEDTIEDSGREVSDRPESEPSDNEVVTPAAIEAPVAAVQVNPLPSVSDTEDYLTYREDPSTQGDTSTQSEVLTKDFHPSIEIDSPLQYTNHIVLDSQRTPLSASHGQGSPPRHCQKISPGIPSHLSGSSLHTDTLGYQDNPITIQSSHPAPATPGALLSTNNVPDSITKSRVTSSSSAQGSGAGQTRAYTDPLASSDNLSTSRRESASYLDSKASGDHTFRSLSEPEFDRYYQDSARQHTTQKSEGSFAGTLRVSRRSMAHAPQYGSDPSFNSGLDSQPISTLQSQAMPPMQDRVREIRAMPSPRINTRKANLEAMAPFDSRSPSLVPEPLNIKPLDSGLQVQHIDIAAPDRSTQVHTHSALDHASQDSSRPSQDFSDIDELRDLGLGENEFAVALSMPTRVRDQYNSTVQFFNKHVKSFLTGNTDQATLDSMRRLINRLNNVSTHIDLEDDTTQSQREHEVPAEDEANWAVSSSSKFLFLKHLFIHLMNHDKHIAIVAKHNRLLDILERFMIGLNLNYFRVDNGHWKDDRPGSLRISIVPSTGGIHANQPREVDLVVALDASFNASSGNIRMLRTRPQYPGYLAPIVRLYVYCSAEHIQKCVVDGLPMLDSELDRLKATIACISRNRAEVGVLQDSESKPDAVAEEVAAFIESGGLKRNWSLPEILPIKLTGLEIVAHNDSSQPVIKSQQEIADTQSTQISRKRHPDDMDLDESSKRTRISPVNDESYISESIIASQNARISELRDALARAEIAIRQIELGSASKTDQIKSLEEELAVKNEALADQMAGLSGLQDRYEHQYRTLHALKHEKRDLEQLKLKLDQRHEALLASSEKLREENKVAGMELQQAREELTNSAIPEVAELEQAKTKARELTAENGSLKRKIESRTSEAEYAREEYQKASSRATEAVGRINELEREVENQKKLTESAKLQHDNLKTEARLHAQDVEKAKLEAEELKEQLRRRDRGRGMTTRTTSVAPRSPRLGASPVRTGSRAGSRAPGSRPNSPPRGLFGTSVRRPRGMVEQML